jgi:hypothetical protein
MRVFKQLCDRCSHEFSEAGQKPYELQLTAKYHPDDRSSFFAARHRLELCEGCRVNFGEWLGDARKHVPGLVSEVDQPHNPPTPPDAPSPMLPGQSSFRVLVLTKLGDTRSRPNPPPAPPTPPASSSKEL